MTPNLDRLLLRLSHLGDRDQRLSREFADLARLEADAMASASDSIRAAPTVAANIAAQIAMLNGRIARHHAVTHLRAQILRMCRAELATYRQLAQALGEEGLGDLQRPRDHAASAVTRNALEAALPVLEGRPDALPSFLVAAMVREAIDG